MKLEQLRYFVALAEELHFGRASAKLNISQPPLSRQIQALEQELGVSLFLRSNQRVTLTVAGATFLQDIKTLFISLDRAVKRVKGVARGEVGTLIIGMTGSVSYGLVPRLLQQFRGNFPMVSIEIRHLVKGDQVKALSRGEITLGFTRSPAPLSNVVSDVLYREPFLVAFHESRAFAQLSEVPLEMLADERFVLYSGNYSPSIADEIVAMCAEAGFSTQVDQDTGEMQTAVSLVAAGLGVTLVAESICRLSLPGVEYRPLTIKGKPRATNLYMIYRSDEPNPALRSFLDLAKTFANA
jgi:DNA-binding transcriptional LysR family regulator